MHPQQRAAWFVLIVIVATLVLYAAAVPALSWWFHRTIADAALPALGVFGLTGLTGFATLFYRAPGGGVQGHRPIMDERDSLLSWRAWSAGMAIFWLLFCVAGVGAWAYLFFLRGLQWVTVPVGMFPGMVYAAFMVFMVARSLATLHFYGWKANDAGE
jgi:hypothetical protein